MKINNKNIFLSCSYTAAKNMSVFDKDKRIKQLLDTIESCSSVDDHINIISEGSILSKEDLDILEKHAVILQNPIDDINTRGNKSYGSLVLWQKALEQLEIPADSNVYFLAGRYRLTSDFSTQDFQSGDYVFKNHWYEPYRGGWYGTQLFKVSGHKINVFLDVLKYAERYIHDMDIECSLYRSFYDLRIMPTEIPMVNCVGELGLSGKENLH